MVKTGYCYIKKPNHPNANKNGRIKRSRYVMSIKLGRALKEGEVVHHINGDKMDDRPENLELLEAPQHNSITAKARIPNVCYCKRSVNKDYNITGFNYRKIFKMVKWFMRDEIYRYS